MWFEENFHLGALGCGLLLGPRASCIFHSWPLLPASPPRDQLCRQPCSERAASLGLRPRQPSPGLDFIGSNHPPPPPPTNMAVTVSQNLALGSEKQEQLWLLYNSEHLPKIASLLLCPLETYDLSPMSLRFCFRGGVSTGHPPYPASGSLCPPIPGSVPERRLNRTHPRPRIPLKPPLLPHTHPIWKLPSPYGLCSLFIHKECKIPFCFVFF